MADDTVPAPSRQEQYARLHAVLVDEWALASTLVRGSASVWRTLHHLHALPALHTPSDSLFPLLPLDLSLHILSFLHTEPGCVAPSVRAVSRAWAVGLSKLTWDAAQRHVCETQRIEGGQAGVDGATDGRSSSLHRMLTVADHTDLMLAVVTRHDAVHGNDSTPLWSTCMCALMERIQLQLLTSHLGWCCTATQRRLLLQWLSRIALTLPNVDSQLAAQILLRSVCLADELRPRVASVPLHYLCMLLLIANSTLWEGEDGDTLTLALTAAQGATLMDEAYTAEQVREATTHLRQRVLQRMQAGDEESAELETDALSSHASASLLHTAPRGDVAAAVWLLAADILARLEPSLLDPSASTAAASAAAASSQPVPLPCAYWFTTSTDAMLVPPVLQPIRVEHLCSNLESLMEWQLEETHVPSPSPAAAATPSMLLSTMTHMPPVLQRLWSVSPSSRLDVFRALVECCTRAPALQASPLLPRGEFLAPFMRPMPPTIQRLQQVTWAEALGAYIRRTEPVADAPSVAASSGVAHAESSSSSIGGRTATVDSSVAAVPPAAAAPAAPTSRAPPSKARWGLLKRALVKSAAADGADDPATDVSVRRHQGFNVMRSRVLQADEIARLAPPEYEPAKDASKYMFVQYEAPQLRYEPSEPGSGSASTALASPSPLHFRLRRASSVSVSELAPDQRIDNTGNICVWNSEEVLAYVACRLLRRDVGSTQLPASLFVATQPAGRPLRILELGAGMSGLCGLALAAAASTRAWTLPAPGCPTDFRAPAIGEVVVTDGNEACVEAMRYQLAWNEVQRARADSSAAGTDASQSACAATILPSSHLYTTAAAHVPVSAQALAWDRHADYSALGKFDLILAADCLFFSAFHVDLLRVLRSLLQPDTGRAWLLAPTRGGSLDAFVALLEQQSHAQTPDQARLRVLHRLEQYDEDIWRQHEGFLQQAAASASAGAPASSTYAPDLHFPLLLNVQLASPTSG